MKEMMNWLKEEESGQGMVEYALIIGLISIVAIIAVTAAGTKVKELWEAVEKKLSGVKVE